MRSLAFLFASILVAGCPTRNQLATDDGGQPDSDGARSDGARSDTSEADGDGNTAVVVPNSVSITSPTTATTYTNGSVSIVVSTEHPASSAISIVATGTTAATVGTVTAPQASFNWNTTGVPEGTYSVTAQLTSNGKTVTSNPVTIVVDRTPPQVVVSSLVPAPGSRAASLVQPIQAAFSEPVLLSTVNATSIPIHSGSNLVPTAVTLSADGKSVSVTITSNANVIPSSGLAGSFASSITDLAGNALQMFATNWSWVVPGWIKYAPLNSTSPPLIAVNNNYQPIVGYTLCGPGNSGNSCTPVMHLAVSDGQAWNDLGIVGQGAEINNSAIFVDAQNHPNLGWGFGTPGNVAEVVFASWDGTQWLTTTYPPIILPTNAGSYVDAVAIALDSMGRPFVAYRGQIVTPSSNEIYVASWTGSTWDTDWGAVGDITSKSFDLALTNAGAPIVSVVNTDNLSGAFVWNGISWTFTGGVGATTASLGVDTTGNPVMLSSATTTWIPQHLTNGSWVPDVTFSIPSSTTASSPTFATDNNWLPVVAWYEPTQSPPAIGLARWTTGSSWDVRSGYANNGSYPNVTPPALVVDGRNSVWVGWQENQQINVWMSNY